MKGWRRQGRQRKRWEDNIREPTGLEFSKSQRAVENREKWRKLVAKSSVVPQWPLWLRDWWWWLKAHSSWKVDITFFLSCTTILVHAVHTKARQALMNLLICCLISHRDGDVARLVECWTGTLLTQVRFPGAARDSSPRVNFLCRFSYMCPYTSMCYCMHR